MVDKRKSAINSLGLRFPMASGGFESVDGYGTNMSQCMDMVAWIQVKRGSLGMEIPLKTRKKNSMLLLLSHFIMSDSVRHHRRQPTRLLSPWDSPGKNTGVGCHFLLQCMKVKSESEVSQLCPTLCNPMDCSMKEKKVKVKSLIHVQLFATPWTVAYQAPPPMGFSKQEYWSGLPFPSPGDLI